MRDVCFVSFCSFSSFYFFSAVRCTLLDSDHEMNERQLLNAIERNAPKLCEIKNARTIKSRDISYPSVNGTNRKLLSPDALSFTSSLCGIHAIINFEYFNNGWHDETNIKCTDTVVRERKWRKRSNTFTCITHPRVQVPANEEKNITTPRLCMSYYPLLVQFHREGFRNAPQN